MNRGFTGVGCTGDLCRCDGIPRESVQEQVALPWGSVCMGWGALVFCAEDMACTRDSCRWGWGALGICAGGGGVSWPALQVGWGTLGIWAVAAGCSGDLRRCWSALRSVGLGGTE